MKYSKSSEAPIFLLIWLTRLMRVGAGVREQHLCRFHEQQPHRRGRGKNSIADSTDSSEVGHSELTRAPVFILASNQLHGTIIPRARSMFPERHRVTCENHAGDPTSCPCWRQPCSWFHLLFAFPKTWKRVPGKVSMTRFRRRQSPWRPIARRRTSTPAFRQRRVQTLSTRLP